MKSTLLLNSNANTRAIEEEEKLRFVRSILEIMGVPIDDFWAPDSILSVEDRIKLRSLLSSYNIKIIDDLDGGLQIYVDNQKIAEWKKCEYKLKRDLSELDPTKQLYLEMQVDFWSIFEEE
jgi:hypothetical protein